MFRRATIRLGIGPHSSYILFYCIAARLKVDMTKECVLRKSKERNHSFHTQCYVLGLLNTLSHYLPMQLFQNLP